MANGRKTGGRKTGTPNKRTAEVSNRLSELGCDPIEGMAKLAMDEGNSPELRGRMYAELAGFVVPKRKAIDFRDVTTARPAKELSDDELNTLIAAERDRITRGLIG